MKPEQSHVPGHMALAAAVRTFGSNREQDQIPRKRIDVTGKGIDWPTLRQPASPSRDAATAITGPLGAERREVCIEARGLLRHHLRRDPDRGHQFHGNSDDSAHAIRFLHEGSFLSPTAARAVNPVQCNCLCE
jgi:hypothetical protein